MIRILKYGEVANSDIFARAVPAVNVEAIVSEIIENVRERGDAALFEYCKKFDKAELTTLQVSEAEIDEALAQTAPELIEIMKKAAANIRRFHERQVRNSFIINNEDGIIVGQKIIPVDLEREMKKSYIDSWSKVGFEHYGVRIDYMRSF